MRWLTLAGLAILFGTGCHSTHRGGPLGFGLLGSNPGNGVATAPPVYSTPPQFVQQPAPIAAAPQQVVAAPIQQQPVIVQQPPVVMQSQVVQQPQTVQPAAYYQSNACAPACPPVCCQPCQ